MPEEKNGRTSVEGVLEFAAKFLAEGGGELGLVLKAWGLVSLGDWLTTHPFAFYVGAAVILLAGLTAAKSKG
jgi:hypothetical protein